MTRTRAPRLPIVFVMSSLALSFMGIGLIIPVMPALLTEVSGAGLANAALWGGVLSAGFAVMQFLFGPVIGGLSDRFGRRPVLLVSLAGMIADYIVMALAGSIWLLLLARLIGGVLSSTQSTAIAFMADVSSAEQKSANFGLVGAMAGLGFVAGPILGGLLAEYGTRAPFWAAAGLSALNLCLGLLVMPESLRPENRRAFALRRANPFGALKAISKLPGLKLPLVVLAIYEFAQIVYPAIWAFFTAERFGWSPGTIGLSLALFGIGLAVMQGFVLRLLLPRFGEWRLIVFGLCANLIIFTTLGLIDNGALALMLTPLTALGAIVVPPLKGLMSRATPDNQQGELQGLLQSIYALALIAAPLVFTAIFFAFSAPGAPVYLPGAPFLLASMLMLVSGVILWLAVRARAVPVV